MITNLYYRDIEITMDEHNDDMMLEAKLVGINLLVGTSMQKQHKQLLSAMYNLIDHILDDRNYDY